MDLRRPEVSGFHKSSIHWRVVMRELIFLIAILLSSYANNAFALELKSPAFKDGEYIPDKYTADAEDVSPPLFWKDAPANTKSFVLICDDPDAPVGTWVHWVIFNIPGDATRLDEDIPKTPRLPDGTTQGINDFRKLGYGGPSPPPGRPHRYFFKLYALDTLLSLKPEATKKQVLKAMQGHIIDQATLISLYKR
jgi:hypothetical protein